MINLGIKKHIRIILYFLEMVVEFSTHQDNSLYFGRLNAPYLNLPSTPTLLPQINTGYNERVVEQMHNRYAIRKFGKSPNGLFIILK